MGYFANGTEGDIFEEMFCSRCVHQTPEQFCPVMALHEVWNGDQIDAVNDRYHGKEPSDKVSEAKLDALDALISRGEDGLTNTCLMFHERAPQLTAAQRVKRETLALCLGEEVSYA